jgi:hypothetical protein
MYYKHLNISNPQNRKFYICANTPIVVKSWVETIRWANCSFLLLKKELNDDKDLDLSKYDMHSHNL